ncbi:MAG: PilZ domain-containing protein [Bacillota bacterium]|nr:PilZ domain-containing protein [Candidatus Fermentithermobacillaceae bacterium]
MTKYTQKRDDFRSDSSYLFFYRTLREGEPAGTSEWRKSATLNLSAGGAAIFVDHEKPAPGDLIEFQLVIPGGPVFGIAQVVRILESRGPSDAVGITFVSVAPGDKDKIAKTVLANGLESRHGKDKKHRDK